MKDVENNNINNSIAETGISLGAEVTASGVKELISSADVPKAYKQFAFGPFGGMVLGYNYYNRFYKNKDKYSAEDAVKVTNGQFVTSTAIGTLGGLLGGFLCSPLGPLGAVACGVTMSEAGVQIHDQVDIGDKPINDHVADFIVDKPPLHAEIYAPPCPSGLCDKPVKLLTAQEYEKLLDHYIESFEYYTESFTQQKNLVNLAPQRAVEILDAFNATSQQFAKLKDTYPLHADRNSSHAESYGPPCPSAICDKPVDPVANQQFMSSFQSTVQHFPTGVVKTLDPSTSVSGHALAKIVCDRDDKECIAKFESGGKNCTDTLGNNCHESSHTKYSSPSGGCTDTQSASSPCRVAGSGADHSRGGGKTECNSPSGGCADTQSTSSPCKIDSSFLSSRGASSDSASRDGGGGNKHSNSGGGGSRVRSSNGNPVRTSGGGYVMSGR
ncbi:MAG: hypothetical protein K0R73_548 [Candidatus Midichloriaceae bacterium]|jgi:hypothetical protein|nr:hypothetical protein [Candidatus Midichloriaceae bacterium]